MRRVAGTDVPGTGEVWQPANADEGFDPYGYGNWVYVNSSYVWASGYSWGWTPYRCGNWQYFSGFGWGWQPNALCGSFGFAGGGGGGILIRGKYPPRYGQVIRPEPRPIRPRPLIPVHGPDGMRPPLIQGGQRRLAGATVVPLGRVAVQSSRGGSAVGQALLRDFPVNRGTREPLIGVEPGSRAAAAGEGVGEEWVSGSIAVAGEPAFCADAGRASPICRSTGERFRDFVARLAAGSECAGEARRRRAPVHVQAAPSSAPSRPAAPGPPAAPRVEPPNKPK